MSIESSRPEEALTSSEQELRLLVEAIPALVWRAGPEGNIEYVNRRMLDYFGAPLGEIIGWGWMEKVHPDDVAFKVKTWLQNLESGKPHDAVCRFRGADGRYRWFEICGEPLRASDCKAPSWYGVLIDIDDRRKAENALRESEYTLRQIIDTVPGLIWSTGPDGEPTHVSQRLLDYSGMRFAEFKHRGWGAFVHPADFPQTAKAYDHAIQSGTSYQGALRLRRADGEFRWHHVRYEPLRDRQGRVIQWYGLSVDIDEAKKAEEQPRSAAQLQATLNVIPTYAWYAAPSGGLTFVNKRTADYLGLPKDHPLRFGIDIGAQWDDWVQLLHPDDQEESRRVWSTCLRTGEAGEHSFRVRNVQGGYQWFLSRSEPLRASDGTLLQWVGVNLDIEELKRTEEALRESEQRFRDYARAASDWYWETDTDHKFTRITDYERLVALGFTPVSRIGLTRWDYATDVESEPEKWELHRSLLEARQPFRDFVYMAARSDGSLVSYKTSGKPIYDAKGAFLGYRGTGADVTATTRAEQALRESEYRLHQIIETVPGLVWSAGPDGEFTQVNRWFLDYSGMRFDDFLHGGWTKFVHPDDVPETANAFSRALQTGTSYQAVHRLRRADGEYRWHHERGEPLRDGQGRIMQWYGLSVDIEERKQAEDRLRRSEAYLAEAQRLSHTGSFGWTPSTGELHWSDETFRILGYDLSIKPTIERVLQRIHPDDLTIVRHVLDETPRSEKIDTKHRLMMPDGSVKFVHVLGHASKDAGGNLEIAGAVMDVTETTRLYRDLSEREAKIRRLVDANIVGIFVWDFEGRILEANDAFLRIIRYDRDDLSMGALRWTDLTPPDWRERDEQWVREHKASGLRSAIEKEYFRRDGSRVPVLVGAATFEEGGSQGVGFVIDLTELKRAERAAKLGTEALRRNEAYLAEAQKLSHTGSVAFDDTTILYWSDETYRILGFDPRKGLPSRETVAERTHPADRERVRKQARRAVRQKRDYTLVYRIVLPAGSIKHVELNAHPKFSPSGELVEIVGTLIDVTERKRAEEERKKAADLLRRSEAHLAEAQRLSHTGAVAYNGTAILFASEETYHIWGFDPAQGLPSREVVFQRIHPGDLDWLNAEVRRAVGEKRRFSIAYRILLPDGRVKHLETIGQPIFSASGKLVEIFATQTDVTERKRAEEALRESQAKFRDYAESASDWFWEIGPDYKFTILTENAFGSNAADRIGTACWDRALDLETEPDKWRLMLATLDSRQPFRDFVYRGLGGNGSPMYVKASGKPVFDGNGEFHGYRGTGADVTATMRAQEEHERLRQLESDLAHMNRVSMMGELAASLAHEITQPIAAARNNARAALNFLDKRPADLGEVSEALGCVVGDADRAGVIVDRIRDHIKKAPPRKHRFDLNEAVNEVIVLARSAMAENGVSVQTRLMDGLVPVEGDRVQLQQVLLNLVLNATEAMSTVDEGVRELVISTDQSRTSGVLVAVRDSGPGIDPEHVERVFEAFYTTKSTGVGMGLSICRSIINAHGGRLWADPNEPRGAVFQFTLPGTEGLINSLHAAP